MTVARRSSSTLGAGARTSGEMSKRLAKVSAPETPSARAWCTFNAAAARPSSSPSMIKELPQRSRGARAVARGTPRSPRRTGRASRGEGSATRSHVPVEVEVRDRARATGHVTSKGARTMRWVRTGISWSRSAMLRRMTFESLGRDRRRRRSRVRSPRRCSSPSPGPPAG